MTGRDDDFDDAADPSLRSMRAVWLEMRDEEPPARGLDALMAAARSQVQPAAAEETVPSWWQRVFAQLRRPPVLALATAVVLLGGAVVLRQRGERIEATTPEVKEASKEAAPMSAPASAVAPASDEEAEPVVANDRGAERIEPAKPATGRTSGRRSVAVRPEAAEAIEAPRGDTGAIAPAVTIQNEGLAPPTETLDQAPAIAEPPRVRRTPLIEQLTRECEAAATRGDCVAVRKIARQIEQADAAYYSVHVASRPAIKHCLD